MLPLCAALSFLTMTGCAVGPKYQRAAAPVPPTWDVQAPWQPAQPKDSLPKQSWWTIFGDPQLNTLEEQAMNANQQLKAAIERVEQARALTRVQASGLQPSVFLGPSAQEQRLSGNRPTQGSTLPTSPVTQGTYTIPLSITYEADLFGRVRNSVAAANATYQASAADFENTKLIVASDLATDYFQLRESDSEIADVRSAIGYEERGLQLVKNREAGGIASGLDVAQQETVLEGTRTQLALLLQQREQFEHAIAVLTGAAAPTFHLQAADLTTSIPQIPAGVPADVLERRPDVASAERTMAANNAQIGVAKAAYYPDILLTGGAGYESRSIVSLFDLPSTFWSIGASVSQSVFNGGRNRAQLEFAQSGYRQSVANYRNTVLTAFQQVEDSLTALKAFEQAAKTQQLAIQAAQRQLLLANNRYTGGLVTYLDVIQAQETLLSNQRLATQIDGQRLAASVALVRALGGGWDASSLPTTASKSSIPQVQGANTTSRP